MSCEKIFCLFLAFCFPASPPFLFFVTSTHRPLQRGNPSEASLAPSNHHALEAKSPLQSSYAFQEGHSKLEKVIANSPGKPTPAPKPRPDSRHKVMRVSSPKRHRSPESSGATQVDDAKIVGTGTCTVGGNSLLNLHPVWPKPLQHTLGKRCREEHEPTLEQTVEGQQQVCQPLPPAPPRLPTSSDPTAIHDNRTWDSPNTQSASPNAVARGSPGGGRNRELSAAVSPVRWQAMVRRNTDIAAIIRRYPQFCDAMGMTTRELMGMHPKERQPSWALRLFEEILYELKKTEAETAAGGARAQRNIRRVEAGKQTRRLWYVNAWDVCDNSGR